MQKVYQDIVDKGDGDCMRACIASLFELTIEQVPHFLRFGDSWFSTMCNFVDLVGHEMWGTGYPHKTKLSESLNFDGYVIAAVPSRTYEGVMHDVIVDINTGCVAHDPNPNELWLGENVSGIMDSWYLICHKGARDEREAQRKAGRAHPEVSIHEST